MAISYELLSEANTHELLSPANTHLHKTQFLQHPLMELDLEQKAEPILVLFSLFRPKCAFVFLWEMAPGISRGIWANRVKIQNALYHNFLPRHAGASQNQSCPDYVRQN